MPLVRARLNAAVFAASLALTTEAWAGTCAASAEPIALHVGDNVSLADLYGYLAAVPQPGDWVRVRTQSGGAVTTITTGFGAETVAGNRTLWIETRVDAQMVSGAGVMTSTNPAPPVISKTYIVGDAFGPFSASYQVIATVAAIGDKAFRMNDRSADSLGVGPSTPAPLYSLTDGLPFATRQGTVLIAEPKDMTAGGVSVHATHIEASFPSVSIAGVDVPATVLDVWQSPDVPLGTVASSGSILGASRSSSLAAFGRGNYRSAIGIGLDALRGQSAGA
ncbi:MAG TPA: hypothetical protein VJN22_07415 [Candidatus Eremiobacteraceae bacterium]|nr:hypothetical protein [Candidatus Eremiobacteraceae bacterium]